MTSMLSRSGLETQCKELKVRVLRTRIQSVLMVSMPRMASPLGTQLGGLNCFLDNVCLVHFVLFSSLSGRVVFPFVLICSYERNKVVSVGC